MSTATVRRSPLVVALLAALALLLAPAAARADAGPVAVGGADLQTAVTVAQQHWGAVPCGGAVALSWSADADPLHNAAASWSNPVDLYSAPERNQACAIELNSNASWTWPKLCTVVAHEMGHLLGHQHSADPTDLMAPIYAAPLPACATLAEPEGTLTAAAAAAAAAAPAAAPVVPVAVATATPAPAASRTVASASLQMSAVAATGRIAAPRRMVAVHRTAAARRAALRRAQKARAKARAAARAVRR